MVMHRDRWPAVLTREQEGILMSAGFHYDPDLGVLVNPKLRKVLAVEAAAERVSQFCQETLPLGVGAI
jgi:hypothetical protein